MEIASVQGKAGQRNQKRKASGLSRKHIIIIQRRLDGAVSVAGSSPCMLYLVDGTVAPLALYRER